MAKEKGKRFRVIVADSRPLLEGKCLIRNLSAAGIPCTYINLNAVCYVIRTVNKVFLGAAALLSNGAVISRAGTALGESRWGCMLPGGECRRGGYISRSECRSDVSGDCRHWGVLYAWH
jgi:hypothetical protein